MVNPSNSTKPKVDCRYLEFFIFFDTIFTVNPINHYLCGDVYYILIYIAITTPNQSALHSHGQVLVIALQILDNYK